MYIGTLYSCSVLMTLEFSRQIFLKNPQISNFMKIRPVEAGLFHADRRTAGRTDGRTDGQKNRHDEANSRFLQFCESAA
jgi:hypothetical protein